MSAPDDFDGEAISQADREFLAKLGDHPLLRNSLYGAPPPPLPDYATLGFAAAVEAAQKACFAAALDWTLVNYAFCKSAFMGKGGTISLIDGEMGSLTSLRGFMQPYTLVSEGPLGGTKKASVVDAWMSHPSRAHIDKIQTRSDRPRPTFVEDGLIIFNRYRPPAHPPTGGTIAAFEIFFENLVPDPAEREWLWHWIAHKARRPWLPMIAVIMVAEKHGTGRGTLFEILTLLFGQQHVWPCSFGDLTGASASARFNAHLANTLIAVVNEAVDEDGHQQSRRRLAYEALKNAVDPAPTALRRYEAKGQHAFAQLSAMSVIIATNHRDVIKLPRDDRRFCVIRGGDRMAIADTQLIRAWMAVPENIGALYRALLTTPAVPTTCFDPFDNPPPFEGRLDMIDIGATRLEDAYGAAIDALDGCSLFTLSQLLRLIGCFGQYTTGDWSNLARYAVSKNAHRLRKRDEAHNRITYSKRQEIIYARTLEDQKRWHGADKEMIIRQLDHTEAKVVRIVGLGIEELADLARFRQPGNDDE
jgi:hypothetical protein